jgi:tetratricopeptide (TPR) repeat protein
MTQPPLSLSALTRRAWTAHATRPTLIAHALLCVTAAALSFIPLLNILGFEFSVAICAAVTLIVGPITTLRLRAAPLQTSLSGPASLHLFAHNLPLLLGPLALISLNALRVQVCDYWGGLTLYALLPLVTTLQATLCAQLTWYASKQRMWLANLLYALIVLSSIGGALAYLALEPPIVTVNPFIGYFAGSIYDEALAVPWPLLSYRLLQLSFLIACTCALHLAHLHRLKRLRAASPWLWTTFALTSLTSFIGHSQHAALGYSLHAPDIQAALGARHETQHFIIYYPAGGDWARRIDRIAEDHEFRYAQLQALFQEDPASSQKLVSYIYPSREDKGRLMGARNTLVAKLWLGDMHITYERYGSSSLKHELAHLFTAPFGSGPLSLSTPGLLIPNMGLVEGAAAAAEWPIDTYSPHGAAAALLRLGLAPDLTQTLSAASFWSQNNRTVYTLYGSFVRWLIDTHGISTFKRAYASSDIASAYNTPLPTLLSDWKASLSSIPLSDAELELMRERYDRPSIFGKTCARNLAERRRTLSLDAASNRFAAATAEAQTICRLDPDNPHNLLDLQRLQVRASALQDALSTNALLLDHPKTSRSLRASALEDQADILWRLDRSADAAALYQPLLDPSSPSSPDQRRALSLKLAALSDPALSSILRAYFLDPDASPLQTLSLLYAARRDLPQSAPIAYLLGLRLFDAEAYPEALLHLHAALSLGLSSQDLSDRASFLLASAAYFTDDLPLSLSLFTQLSTSAAYEGDRAIASDWAARAQWRLSSLSPH